MRDFGMTAAKLIDVLTNDFAGRDLVSATVDVPAYVQALAQAESEGMLDEARFDDLTKAFVVPLSAMGVEYLSKTQEETPSSDVRADEPAASLVSDGPGSLALRVRHFKDGGVLACLRENHAEISSAQSLVVDLREASEGVLGNAFCLMALLFSEQVNLKELMGAQKVRSLYTVRNARYRLEQLARMLPYADQDSRAQLEREAAHIQECAKAGWVEEAEYYEPLACPPAPEGLSVTVLVSEKTAAAAEQVALVLRKAQERGIAHARLEGDPSGRAAYESFLRVPLDDRSWIVYPMTKACEVAPVAESAR